MPPGRGGSSSGSFGWLAELPTQRFFQVAKSFSFFRAGFKPSAFQAESFQHPFQGMQKREQVHALVCQRKPNPMAV